MFCIFVTPSSTDEAGAGGVNSASKQHRFDTNFGITLIHDGFISKSQIYSKSGSNLTIVENVLTISLDFRHSAAFSGKDKNVQRKRNYENPTMIGQVSARIVSKIALNMAISREKSSLM